MKLNDSKIDMQSFNNINLTWPTPIMNFQLQSEIFINASLNIFPRAKKIPEIITDWLPVQYH